MIFREALTTDIKQLHDIRMSVRENALHDPTLITVKEYEEFLNVKGKGWVCEIKDSIVGFAIIDLEKFNIWALFVKPEHEGKGIGKKLQNIMLTWYFSRTKHQVWVCTIPNTKAELFYKNHGWLEAGRQPNGDIRFELNYEGWRDQFTN